MIYRIEYANAAQADLRDIGSYLRRVAGDEVAKALVDDIMEKVETLSLLPERQRLRRDLAPGLRAIAVGSYLIFYRVLSDTVMIARILHGSRDITAESFRAK